MSKFYIKTIHLHAYTYVCVKAHLRIFSFDKGPLMFAVAKKKWKSWVGVQIKLFKFKISINKIKKTKNKTNYFIQRCGYISVYAKLL